MAAEQSAKSVRTTDVLATGRRKTAVARVRLRSGSGTIKVNGRALDAYFPTVKDRTLISGALEQLGKQSAVNIDITVDGGGLAGQAGACRLGIARALKTFDVELAETLGRLAPGNLGKVLFTTGGSDAIEVALASTSVGGVGEVGR